MEKSHSLGCQVTSQMCWHHTELLLELCAEPSSGCEWEWHFPQTMPPAQKNFCCILLTCFIAQRVNKNAMMLSGLLHYSVRTAIFTQ